LDGFRSRFDILCQENLTTKEKLEQLKSRLSEEMVNIMTLSLNMENLNSLKSDVEAVRTAQQNHQRSLDVLYADLTAAIKRIKNRP
jgi:tRNA U34 5-carboxymethylaminomethyl modifying GTPase MnmE/TrmE